MRCNWKTSFIKSHSVNATILEPFIFRAANEDVFALYVLFKPYGVNGTTLVVI